MTPQHSLYLTMVNNGMVVHPGTVESIKEAINDKKIHFFKDGEGKPIGFVTWYFEDEDLVVNNLVILKDKRGFSKLFVLRKMFHSKYPNLKKVKWSKEKNRKPFETHFGEKHG